VAVSCRVWDQYGEPVLNARVAFVWRLPDGTRTFVRKSSLRGLALTRVRAPAAGRRVVVSVRVTYKGQTRSRGVAFVPRSP
jgi:hypothetical protein